MVRAEDLLKYEKGLLDSGFSYICGVDEVGRGPLAGPVVCSAVIMPLNPEFLIQGINDSKKVSKSRREVLYDLILERAISVSTVFYDNQRIDDMNILQATKECMKEAIGSLSVSPDVVLVDAIKLDIPYKTLGIIHGDALSYSIAAASIVAKVTRDRYMREMAQVYPGYDFENNSGYGTPKHIAALKELGATPLHRKTFIKNFV